MEGDKQGPWGAAKGHGETLCQNGGEKARAGSCSESSWQPWQVV